jgi:hypothetical protein
MRFWVFLLVLVLGSCSKKEPEPAAATETTEAAEAAETPAQAEGSSDTFGDPGLKLLTPGQAPRVKLRRSFKQGFKQQVDVKTGMKGTVDAPPSTPPAPSIHYMLTVETKEVASDGSKATVDVLFDKQGPANENPNPLEISQHAEMDAMFRGAQARYTVSSLGRADPIEFNVSDDIKRHLMHLEPALVLLGLPFPEDEIGKGAQWTFVEALGKGPDQVQRRTTYEITKIDRSRVDVGLKIEQTAPQRADGRAISGLTGTGEVTWDLTKLAPVTATRWVVQQFADARGAGHEATWKSWSVQLSGR